MFKTTKSLKEFILWAKSEGIAEVKVGELAVRFAPGALTTGPDSTHPVQDNRTPDQIKRDQEKEENEILFWSAR